jgi:hypothetical protein
MAKIIFLDIDGVLNAGSQDEPFILPECAQRLNRIIQETGAGVVLSSAWRQLILLFVPECVQRLNRILEATKAGVVVSSSWRDIVHARQMTEVGFEYMLWSHGLKGKVWGVTCRDAEIPWRGKQIAAWLSQNGPVQSYLVIDDDNYDFRECGHPFVQTNGGTGISGSRMQTSPSFS